MATDSGFFLFPYCDCSRSAYAGSATTISEYIFHLCSPYDIFLSIGASPASPAAISNVGAGVGEGKFSQVPVLVDDLAGVERFVASSCGINSTSSEPAMYAVAIWPMLFDVSSELWLSPASCPSCPI